MAQEAYQYCQKDICLFEDLIKETGKKQPDGSLIVDAFSKYCQVVPIKSKHVEDVLEGLKEVMKLMQKHNSYD